MTSAAPSAATGARLCGPAVAITSAPRSDPRDTSRRPVTPPAPVTRRRSPGPTPSASSRTCAAVSAGTGNTAAASQETPAGLRAIDAEGAISVGAHVPWSRSGSGWVITSSPDVQSVTMLPTAVTRPAASTPSAIGGARHPPPQPGAPNSGRHGRPATNPPAAGPNELIPVAHARRPDLNQHLVPSERTRPRYVDHANVVTSAANSRYEHPVPPRRLAWPAGAPSPGRCRDWAFLIVRRS